MSKKSKAKAKQKRLNQKRSRKAARQATYEGYAKAGIRKKSKRFRKGSKSSIVGGVRHAVDYCGNLGCILCFEEFNNPWKANRESCIYSKRFTSSKFVVQQSF